MEQMVIDNTIMSQQQKMDMSLSDAEDSGINSCDSDIDSNASQTARLKDEIMVLKAVIKNKNEQTAILVEGISRYEQQIGDKNKLIQGMRYERNKHTAAYDTVMKMNKILKNNAEILEKSLLNKTSLLEKSNQDYNKIYQLKENPEKTLRD